MKDLRTTNEISVIIQLFRLECSLVCMVESHAVQTCIVEARSSLLTAGPVVFCKEIWIACFMDSTSLEVFLRRGLLKRAEAEAEAERGCVAGIE